MNHENKNRNIPFQSQKSVGAEASTKTGWAQVEKIKNKRSFGKLKVDGVKIANLSSNQELKIAIKISNTMTGIVEYKILAKSIYKLRSLLFKPIPMKSVVVTTTIPAIFKEYVGTRQFMGQPRNIIQYSIFHTSSLLLKESGLILKGI